MDGSVSGGLVGRRQELAVLSSYLDDLEGGASALIIEGEAGIGKTTVWRTGLRDAVSRGCRTLSCRPTTSEARFSFVALGDLVEGVLAERLPQLPPAQRRALEQALVLADAEGPAVNERAVALAFLGVLRLLAREGPVVVAIDDTQWLDRPTAAVLEFIARRLAAEPIGLLLARRSDGLVSVPLGLERALLEERVRRLRLEGLSLDALHELLRVRLEVAFARPILLRLHEASAGNPFCALEIGRALLRNGGELSAEAPLPVPETLRELVHDRLAQLPARTREALVAAAALSRPTLALADAALPGGAGAAPALAKAVEADVVEIALDGRIRFTHPLLASTLYSETPLARRRRLHRRLAAVLSDPEEAARHLALAAETPDATVAATLDRAAAAARARGAPATAAALCEQARRLTPPGRAGDLWRRTIEASEYNGQAGDPQRGRQLAEAAIALAPGSRERAESLNTLGRIHRWDDLPRALRCFQEALAEPGIDAATSAASLHDVAITMFFAKEDLPAAAMHARAAVEAAAELDPLVLARALTVEAQIATERGDPRALAMFERPLALEATTRHWRVLRHASYAQTDLFVRTDRLEDARAGYERHYEQALEQGDESSLAVLLFKRGEIQRLLGSSAEARRLGQEAYERSLETGDLRVQAAFVLGSLVRTYALLGLVDETRDTAERGLELARRAGANGVTIVVLGTLGLLELSLGQPARAHELLARAATAAQAAGRDEPTLCDFVTDDVEALAALGRLDEAERLLAPYEERARGLDRASALAACARCRGLVHAASGDLAGALRALEQALEQHKRVPNPFERARTLLVLGATRRRAKQKLTARESLDQALDEFERLEARLWAEKARAELHRIGGRAASPRDLTPTEERVAELVAAGHSNREVAAALFLSVRTVDWNLAKIYRKLGIHSRRELTARAGPATGS